MPSGKRRWPTVGRFVVITTVSAMALLLSATVAWITDPMDRCLDGGGSWDAGERVCRTSVP
jgi:hypothetical protein